MPAAIRFEHVDKSFGGRKVLADLTLEVSPGETLVLLGLSGAGKSTLLRLAAGLEHPDAGEIVVLGENIHRLSEEQRNTLRRNLGFVFQYAALFDSLTVFENVAFRLLRDLKFEKEKARLRAAECLSWVGLSEEVLDLYPSQLSGGMRKRVGLARAIAVEPKILLYDEPTSGLDPITSTAINELILSLQRRLNVTSVVVTHDLKGAFHVASRVGLLYDGKIHGLGPPEAVRESSDPWMRQFLRGDLNGPIQLG